MLDCIFCKIAEGSVPCKRVYEDDRCIAFHDIAPQAKHHVLVVPKRHIASLQALTPGDADLIGHMLTAIPQIAETVGLSDGYRVVTNVGPHGCQSVKHLHFHILGGRQLSGQMG